MKKDLDRLMKKLKVDAIYAEGHSSHDTDMFYLLNGASIFAHYIKKRGVPAYVVHVPIEREVAKETGHRLINMNHYDRHSILEKFRENRKANAYFVSMLFNDLKVKGSVAFYGNFSLGGGYNYARHIRRACKNVRIFEAKDSGLITRARMTKDGDEIKRMKAIRNGVVHAFEAMLRYVRGCRVKNNGFLYDGKKRLLIGDLRRVIRRELFMRGYIDSAGLIVAQGRDAGVPHNKGRDRQPVKAGKTIVFDIFPQEIGGGYFFDFTRTVCFGYADKPVRKLYDTVAGARDYAFSLLKVGRRTRDVERKICEYFEKEGHRTFLSDAKNQVGYCHSLGHGVGLDIHERPFFNLLKTNTDCIEPGVVFTIEPGLYYPDKGYGVRIEEVVYINERGRVVDLTSYPHRLVVPM